MGQYSEETASVLAVRHYRFLFQSRGVQSQGACRIRFSARHTSTRCGGPSFCFRRSFTVAKGERSGGEVLSPFRLRSASLLGLLPLGVVVVILSLLATVVQAGSPDEVRRLNKAQKLGYG